MQIAIVASALLPSLLVPLLVLFLALLTVLPPTLLLRLEAATTTIVIGTSPRDFRLFRFVPLLLRALGFHGLPLVSLLATLTAATS